MRWSDIATLLLLGALWGASYLFMRMGAGEFGPVALAGARAAGAALLLLPLLARRDGLADLRRHWKPIALVGLTSAALPFVLFGVAALSIGAGLSAIFNAATPLYAAAIGWLWLGDRLSAPRAAGLAIGFAACCRVHGPGLSAVLPADRQRGRTSRRHRRVPDPRVRRPVGRDIPGRGLHLGDGLGLPRDPGRYRAHDRADQRPGTVAITGSVSDMCAAAMDFLERVAILRDQTPRRR